VNRPWDGQTRERGDRLGAAAGAAQVTLGLA